jgi:hypothetical protein
MEAIMAENSGMLLWMWLLIAPVVALFVISPGGTTTLRTADGPLADGRRDRRMTDDSTMVEGVPDSELYSKREIRPS